ncbi:sulfotransferase family 2 domain-containing protein [Oricola sp.]|uniref:sulfotransferase family 2 domain-containing protein n=1 Tax=Oricola sp. TaxID=1979950 RepID=UPI0025CEAE6B|nr:sulfotransferase family 2 domain-containing protein [Oricola sp.]MCI5075287.1 sulfotransferase family protein [Oricola sp.]
MILSLTHRFLFIHVPKTAGTSVRVLLSPYSIRPDKSQYRRFLSHLPVREDPTKADLRQHATAGFARVKLGDELFSDLYKFTFVRNPFDRMVSAYEFTRSHTGHHRHDATARMSFSEFLAARRTRLSGRRKDQCDFIFDRSGNLLMDDVYRFESLSDEIATLCQKLGVEKPETLPHRKRIDRRAYREYYTAKDREIASRMFARDLERFDYSF